MRTTAYLYCPGELSTQPAVPDELYVPSGHNEQGVLPPSEYWPGTQVIHAGAPTAFPYCPATQAVHDDAPGGENEPTSHGAHEVAPATELY